MDVCFGSNIYMRTDKLHHFLHFYMKRLGGVCKPIGNDKESTFSKKSYIKMHLTKIPFIYI